MTLWIACLSFPVIFLGHCLYERGWARHHPPHSRQKAVILLGLTVCFVLTALAWSRAGILDALYVLLVSLGFAHVYFHIFNMSETARRIRILTCAVAASKERGSWQIPPNYTPRLMIEERFQRLEAMGAIRKTPEGKWVSCFHPLLIAAWVIEKYKRLFS